MLINKTLFLEAWIQSGLKLEFAKKLEDLYPNLHIQFDLFASLKKAVATYKVEKIGRSEVTKKRLVPELWIKIRFLDKIVATFFKTEEPLLVEIIQKLMQEKFPSLEVDIKII